MRRLRVVGESEVIFPVAQSVAERHVGPLSQRGSMAVRYDGGLSIQMRLIWNGRVQQDQRVARTSSKRFALPTLHEKDERRSEESGRVRSKRQNKADGLVRPPELRPHYYPQPRPNRVPDLIRIGE